MNQEGQQLSVTASWGRHVGLLKAQVLTGEPRFCARRCGITKPSNVFLVFFRRNGWQNRTPTKTNKRQLMGLADGTPESRPSAVSWCCTHTQQTWAHSVLFNRCSHVAVMFTVFPTWTCVCVCVCCIFIECSVVRVFVLVFSIFDRSVIFW